MITVQNINAVLISFTLGLIGTIILIAILIVVFFALLIFYRNRHREKESLNSTLLQVSLPRDNEIKIDAAEQMFSSFASMKKSGKFSFLKLQPSLAFEIVGVPQDIRFYVNTPNKYKDMVEKQINGAYPDAEIIEVTEKTGRPGGTYGNEYNIFTENGKTAFASLKLKTSNYFPIKVFKDLATDSLSSITSVLAKMTEGEGAAIQVMVSPADSKWKKQGGHISPKLKSQKQIRKLPNIQPTPKSWKELKIKSQSLVLTWSLE